MNLASSRFLDRLRHLAFFHTRRLARSPNCESFSAEGSEDAIGRIYVINLDRKPDRWRQLSGELGRIRTRSGGPLSSMSRRCSAVDGRYMDQVPPSEDLLPQYLLSDQLSVAPIPRLDRESDVRDQKIEMTRQEVAVALSHIAVWKLIAAGDVPYALVLEDDVYFRRRFVHDMDEAWRALTIGSAEGAPVDLLYLSFKEVGEARPSKTPSVPLRRPERGLWQLSGYVLSRAGARRLVDLLPVRGPIDLWVNLQFGKLRVLTTRNSIIEQRRDMPSTNSYSVLPILSQIGVITSEKPVLVTAPAATGPVFAWGEPESGLSALATALAMLGYRCCNDLSELPRDEHLKLFGKEKGRAFDAYVNVGSLGPDQQTKLASLYPRARFIFTSRTLIALGFAQSGPVPSELLGGRAAERNLVLPSDHVDKWQLLTTFLGCEYPAFVYPHREELGQRRVIANSYDGVASPAVRRLRYDSSPWIVPVRNWRGIAVDRKKTAVQSEGVVARTWNWLTPLGSAPWVLRDDTFPSNLALFKPDNCEIGSDGIATLRLRQQQTSVRSFTSAAIASRETVLYGLFTAELWPSDVPGLITGLFLHRDAPRQEIDLEFLGRDTTKVLVNVYYNPGNEGARLESGYRGAPALVNLGFDAATGFHRYEIEWQPHFIRWRVDGHVIYERVIWDPTPIPDLPMQFNINLWHCRSRELAGQLDAGRLPAETHIRDVSSVILGSSRG